MSTNKSRREFLRRSLCATVSSAAFGSMLGKLSLAQAAVGSTKALGGSDYRALVCVYLYGGNDSFNMLVPRSTSHYATYADTRGGLAVPQSQLLPLNPLAPPSDGAQYGFHPMMPGLTSLFNEGRAALLANVGTLVQPVTKAQYLARNVPLPPSLASHADQQVLWQQPSGATVDRIGWGGRLADMYHAINPTQLLSMNVSFNGENVYATGADVAPYFMSPDGVEPIGLLEPGQNARIAAFDALQNAAYAHPFERAYARKVARSREVGAALAGALAALPAAPFDGFERAWTDAGLAQMGPVGRQLRMAAKMIAIRDNAPTRMLRQIFFVGFGDFDNHGNQLEDHPRVLRELSLGIKAFDDAMRALGLSENVTLFTASDFGRTLSSNGDGSDHGWGGHHLIVGGSVAGRRVYGTMPNLARNNNPDEAEFGTIIPTTSVDQYAATLARWFGMPDSERATLFPRLGNFATPDLGFLRPRV